MKKTSILFAAIFAGAALSICAADAITDTDIDAKINSGEYNIAGVLYAKKNGGLTAESFEEVQKVINKAGDYCFAKTTAERKAGWIAWEELSFSRHVNTKPAVIIGAYKYAKANNKNLHVFVAQYPACLGLTDAERYQNAMTLALKTSSARDAKAYLLEIGKVFSSIKEETVKADLKTLNKKYSFRMVQDKEAWAPIVQMIRTMLATM